MRPAPRGRFLRAGLLILLLFAALPASARASCDTASLEKLLQLLGMDALLAATPANASAWADVTARRLALDRNGAAALRAAVARWPSSDALRSAMLRALQPGCEPARLEQALATLAAGGLGELRVALSLAGRGLGVTPEPQSLRLVRETTPQDPARIAAVEALLAAERTTGQLLAVNLANARDVAALAGIAEAQGAGAGEDETAIIRRRSLDAQRAVLHDFALEVYLHALRYTAPARIDAARAALADAEVQEFLALALDQLALMLRARVQSP